MAEERLIDDDKDRKFKIIKNADGEDELVIDDTEDVETVEEEVAFEVPEFSDDDEEAAILTPEQLAAREQARAEEAARREAAVNDFIASAKSKMDAGDYESAQYALYQAGELDGTNGEVLKLKILAYTRNFTDYTQLEACADSADSAAANCTAEQKAELFKLSAPLEKKLAEVSAEAERLGAENEEKKAERRGVFAARKRRQVIFFSISTAVFALMLVAAIYFSTLMFSQKEATYIALTVVFAVLALAMFVVFIVAAHKLSKAGWDIKRNESNEYTKLGREYEAKRECVSQLTRIYDAIKGN